MKCSNTPLLYNTLPLPHILYCKTKVCYATFTIPFNKNVFRLYISVCNSWFSFCPKYLRVEVTEATCYGEAKPDHGVVVEGGLLEVIMEGAQWMVVGDEQHLCHGACSFDICGYVTYRRKNMLQENTGHC